MFGALTYKRPINLIAAANLIAYLTLFLNTQPYDKRILTFGLASVIVVYAVYFIIKLMHMGDEYIFLIVAMLTSMGIIMIYRLDHETGLKQAVWLGSGLVFFFAGYFIYTKIKIWDRLTIFYIAASALIFIATLTFGKNINGSTNWIIIGNYSFQTSELIKILFLFFLACYFKNPEDLFFRLPSIMKIQTEIRGRTLLMAVTFMNITFLILQREWGTAVLLFCVYFLLLYVYEGKSNFLLINVAAVIPIALFGYFFIYHIRVRVETWIDPWKDASGKGYQILQSLFAISSGGFFGTGIGAGKPDMVPAVNTDFIFSAICEEMGVFSGIAVILLYFILCYRGIKIVLATEDRFNKVLALGITIMFGFQTFIIIGGVIKFIPLTGITLPFISYGGSSLVTSFVMLGILQAISKAPYGTGGCEENEG